MYDLIAILLIVWGLIFYKKVFFLLRVSLSSHCKAALVVLNSFNYCLSGKLLISLSNLNVSLAKQNIIGYRFFPTVQFSSVQSLSRVSLFATPWMPGLPVHHQLPESTKTHVHWVSDAIQPSHPLLTPSPPALNLSQHQGLFQWVSSLHQMAKVLEFQLQHQFFQWTPRTDFL